MKTVVRLAWGVAGFGITGVAVCAVACRHGCYPPEVTALEMYDEAGVTEFDHGLWDRLLRRHVDRDGWVDYAKLVAEVEVLDRYLAALAVAPFDALSRDGKLALLLNAYNAFTLRLIVEHWPLASIRDIPASERWDAVRWPLAGTTVSLEQLEHRWIRPRFVEPRIHFALVCAAVGCPPLRAEAYEARQLEVQLADQALRLHADTRWVAFDAETGVLRLTALYDWYRDDFAQVAATVADFAAAYLCELRLFLGAGREPTVEWLDYDWRLNDIGNRK